MSEKFRLTAVEQELMDILWQLGQGSVHDVLEQLPENRQLAYTSVSTILRILQSKNIVTAIKIGRTHIYEPILKKKTFVDHSVKNIVKHAFSGNPVELITHLLGKKPLTIHEINAIQKLLDNKKKELS